MSCVIKRILQFNEAIQFGYIKIIDESGKDITNQCQYCYGYDSNCPNYY